MSELIETTQQIDRLEEQFSQLSKDELQSKIRECLQITKTQLINLAALVRVCDERGIDLSDMQLGMLKFVRRIAYGDMSPSLIVKYQGHRNLIDKASKLPLPDQERVATGSPIPVYDAEDQAERLIPPELMTPSEVHQVFSKDGIRDTAEQASWLRSKGQRVKKTITKKASKDIKLDYEQSGIVVNGTLVTSSEMAHYLAQLAGNRKEGQANG